MQKIFDKELVWWRNNPVDVEIGLLSYLSSVWNNKIYIISANEYEAARKQCSWEINELYNVCFITGESEIEHKRELIDRLLNDKQALHIISGVRGDHKKYVDQLKKNGCQKCVMVMESPSQFGRPLARMVKKIVYPILYTWYGVYYRKNIKVLLAFGERTMKLYKAYGWKKVVDFMYLPDFKPIKQSGVQNNEVHMLYIGRFDFLAKGVDILMEAVDDLATVAKWKIDMVGGYGKNADNVIQWCQTNSHAQFIGSWPSDEVIQRMAEYDVCIVPSRYDGWNLTPQQAINAGIGCIVSDSAGSQELIERSGAGQVIRSNKPQVLTALLKHIIEHPEIISTWKDNAHNYAEKISVDNVGKYFVDVMSYYLGYSSEMPERPW